MKSFSNVVAIILIVFGAGSFAYQGFTYKTQDEIVKIGDLKVTTEKEKRVTIPPVLSGIALVLGIGLLVFNRYKN